MKITAEIQTRAFGPVVVVNAAGERLPWEFSVRAAAVRTPMRRRYALARSIEYVRDRLEVQPPRGVPPIDTATIAKLFGPSVITHAHNPAARGYVVSYRVGEVNHCPGCGRSQWHVGRVSAECAFCSTAVPIALQAAA